MYNLFSFWIFFFQFIPVDNFNLYSNFDKLKPDINYHDWEFRVYYSKNDSLYYNLIYTNNNYSEFNYQANLTKHFELPDRNSQYFEALLFKTSNGEIFSVNSLDGLKSFLGQIDNLEEAMFLSYYYGCWFYPNNKKFGSYKIIKDGFLLNGYRMSDSPDFIDVNKKIKRCKIYIRKDGLIKINGHIIPSLSEE